MLALRVACLPLLGSEQPLLALFLIPIFASAYFWGPGPGLLATFVTAVGSAYFVLAPVNRFEIAASFDWVRWLLTLAAGIILSLVAGSWQNARRRAVEARAALTASERQYRLLFEESPVPKWVYDTDTLRFLAVNEAALRHYGYSREEFLAMTLRDIRPPDDVATLEADVARASGEFSRTSEWRHVRKDGSLIHVIVNAHDVELGEQRARLVAVQDITERKHTEAKVQAQLARLGLLHRITRAIAERQDIESILQVVVHSLEDDLPLNFCCMCLHDSDTHELTVTSVGRRSESLASTLALCEQATIPIDENGLSRCVRGQLVYEPEIAESAFPFPQRLAGAGLRSLVFAPLLVENRVFGVLIAARRMPQGFSSGECEFLRQLCEHTALAAHQAQLHGALRQAYDELQRTQQAVLQQERLRALGQMASGIAHDINNAISPAALYAEALLERETGLTPQGRERLGVIQHALDDVTQTVARMREFYRQREPQLSLSPIDPNPLIDQVVEITRARWHDMPQKRGSVIHLVTDLAPSLPPILGVESEIRDALINLVLNAVDAMPDGGTLTLRTFSPTASDHRGRVVLEVVDTGIGMNAETRRRCMEPFFTTKGDRGTGLGLAMVYGMVQRHNATIDIESAPGRGTIVRLSFAVPTTPPRPKIPSRAPFLPRTRLRLLLIDDDPLVLKSLRDALEADGHAVETAQGGQIGIDAFRAAHTRGEPFSAVITDLGMPYVDGRKVASEIRAASPKTPVFLLTGWGERLSTENDNPPDVARVLAKPPKLRELRDVLAQYCSPPEGAS